MPRACEVERNWGVTADDNEYSVFEDDANVLEWVVVIVVQLCECTNNN